ncbi:MAG: hypothetical protein J6B29_01815 [Clostridia bacterium]|nr:hypothetical protein [Clostridia bacterium]
MESPQGAWNQSLCDCMASIIRLYKMCFSLIPYDTFVSIPYCNEFANFIHAMRDYIQCYALIGG